MPEEQIPPVAAVVVAHDPGPWFEECLQSILVQDYPNLVVLVVDAASTELLAPRVASIDPTAYLHRLEVNAGFGPSVNSVLGLVEGASFYLVCHDDVILDPDALRRLVEESYRSNAAVVGPKLVDINEPDLILQFGLSVDRFGAPVRRVEHREFDQSQHDETREVFAVPGGATLVRADLLETLRGFDPEISMFGEDVDLCWRAQMAGAHVVVTPFSVVRHREAAASRQRELTEARALQWRHELRSVLKNYEHLHLVLRVSEMALFSLIEMAYFFVIGHRRRTREVIEAWRWNLAPEQHLKERRRANRRIRRISDYHVAEKMSSGTSRLTRFFRPGIEQLGQRWSTNREVLTLWQSGLVRRGGDLRPRWVTNTMWVAALILVLGGRSLVTSHLPLIGDYLPLPTTTALIGHYFHGSTSAGTQALGPVTPALLWLGLGGIALFGAMGILVKLGLLACIVIGALGMIRLVRPFGPPTARCAAVLTYLYLPLAWNDLARADIGALVAYGVTPYLLARLMRASGQAPFVLHSFPIKSAETINEILSLGVLLTVAAAFEPALLFLLPLMAIGLLLGSSVLTKQAVEFRTLAVALGATVLALVALFPWSLTFIQPGVNLGVLTGAVTDSVHAPQLGKLFRLNVGPYGSGVLSWGVVLGAIYVLVTGRSERFVWGVRLWALALWSVLFTWLGAQGWLGSGFGSARIFIAPFAVVMALLVGLGVATLIEDLRRTTFGLHHLAAFLFVLATTAGLLPILGSTLSGRFDVPTTGYDTLLSWMSPTSRSNSALERHYALSVTGATKVLWLGDPPGLPLTSWEISSGLAFGIASGGLPTGSSIWPSVHESAASSIVNAVLEAEQGSTVRLGSLLARNGIRYLIVPTSVAPQLLGTQNAAPAPAPQILLDALANQDDLHQLPSAGGALIFDNTAASPNVAATPSGLPNVLHLFGVLIEIAIWVVLARVGLRERRKRQTERRRLRTGLPVATPSDDLEPVLDEVNQ